jgi:hypothetical protein
MGQDRRDRLSQLHSKRLDWFAAIPILSLSLSRNLNLVITLVEQTGGLFTPTASIV